MYTLDWKKAYSYIKEYDPKKLYFVIGQSEGSKFLIYRDGELLFPNIPKDAMKSKHNEFFVSFKICGNPEEDISIKQRHRCCRKICDDFGKLSNFCCYWPSRILKTTKYKYYPSPKYTIRRIIIRK